MAPKKKPKGNPALQQLKTDLKAGTPGRLYLFYGEEIYLRDHYLNRLKSLILEEGMEDFNLHTLDGKECTPATLSEAVDNLPMFSQRSMVLVQDYDIFKSGQDSQTEYARILSDLPDYVCVVFLYDTIKPERTAMKGALSKLLKNSTAMVDFGLQDSVDLIPWITSQFKSLGKDIKRPQAEYLIFVAGSRMSNLATEIQKVGAYAKERTITNQDIDAVCEPVLDAKTFQLTDQLNQGQFDKALGVLSDLFASQQSPMLIHAVLCKQLRQMYTARIAYENGKSVDWLVEIWDMKQTWQAERMMRNVRRFPSGWYRTAVLLAADADRKIKLSYKEEQPILTELLLRLAEAART